MRSLVIASLVVFGFMPLVACGDGGSAQQGDTCASTPECADGLICIGQTCQVDPGASLTGCDLGFVVTNAGGKDFGESCTNNSECRFGACIMPGTGGNITNAQFGFCSRGCDCENNTDSRIADEDGTVLLCLYPAGFKDFHHVTLRCESVEDCKAVDAGWTDCTLPNTGAVRKLCHAL